MSLIYPLDLPATNKYRSATMRAQDTVSVASSPYTAQRQVFVYPAQWFETDITLVALRDADKEVWASWLLSLRGLSGSFLFGDPTRLHPRGNARAVPGTPLVKGADQTGDLLTIDGVTPGLAAYLRAGDYIQLGSGATARLHKVLVDANVDSDGVAALTIWPDLRESPDDNAPLLVSNARGVFARTSNSQEWTSQSDGTSSITFGIKEVLT